MIVDNVLPKSYADEVKNALCSDTFPWYFNNGLIPNATNLIDPFQFTHNIIIDGEARSDVYALIKPMLYFIEWHTNIKIKKVVRIKANLITRNNSACDASRTMHQDKVGNYKTFLYYVDDSDGDTILFSEDKKTETLKLTPQANKALYFDSSTWHASGIPVVAKRRVVINFGFEVEDEPS
jgi:predicted nucleotidyltransferase